MTLQRKGRRKTIRAKVTRLVLTITLVSLLLSSLIGFFVIERVNTLTAESLSAQLSDNVFNLVCEKADIADSEFDRFLDCVGAFAVQIGAMYDHPENWLPRDIAPPDASKAGVPTMRYLLRSPFVDPASVQAEKEMLGNLEISWQSVYDQNRGTVCSIYLATADGLHVVYDDASDRSADRQYFNYSGRAWYQQAMVSRKPSFTDFYQDSFGRGLMITCCAPVYDSSSEFRAVVAMDLLIEDVYKRIVSLDAGEGTQVFLMDRNMNTVDPENHTRLINSRVLFEEFERSAEESVPDSDSYFFSAVRVPSTGGTLAVRVPRSAVLGPAERIEQDVNRFPVYLLSLCLLLTLLSIPVIQLFSSSLTRPLHQLGRDAVLISAGNLAHHSDVSTNDEVGDLARSFNQMAASLQQYVADLTRVTAEREHIGAELNIAARIQENMLPRDFPPFPGRTDFDVYASMTPAKEVGGDFYDFFLIDDDHLALVMADVSGKGIPAALFMAISRTLIRNQAHQGDSPADILANVNDQLCEGNREELFVTVWLAVLELSTGKGLAANAGHEHPAVRRAGGQYELSVYRHSPAVAIMSGMRFREHEFELHPGDSLFVYTDGVPEATNARNELFGTDRMLRALNRNPDADPKDDIIEVQRAVSDFVQEAPQFDDITMLALKYHGPEEEESGMKGKTITVDALVKNLSEVAAFIDGELEAADASIKAQMQIDIAVEELFVNVASYAYPDGSGQAEISCFIDPETRQAEITITDSGIPYNPMEKPDPDVTLSAQEREIGGLGIFMAKQSLDEMRYVRQDGRNILTLIKKI